MAAFTVWKFDDPGGADRAVDNLKHAEADRIVKIVDHATVSWPEGAAKPQTKHLHDDVKRGTGWGAFWGVLFGALFLMPVLGGAVGAAIGGLSKATEKVGIRQEDLEKIRGEITEGTSALFVVTEEGDLDRLGERFHGMGSKLVATNLTEAERELLVETFGG
jgi:uncharacterized membrane protein